VNFKDSILSSTEFLSLPLGSLWLVVLCRVDYLERRREEVFEREVVASRRCLLGGIWNCGLVGSRNVESVVGLGRFESKS
jgi:hypothetical protein